MKENLSNFFISYADYIIFIHVFSAVAFIGSSIFFYLLLRQDLLKDLKQAFAIYHKIAITSILFLIATAGIIAIGLDFKHGNPSTYMIVHIKEAIWTIIAITYFMIHKDSKKDDFGTRVQKKLLIILGFAIVAIYLGIKLRGF